MRNAHSLCSVMRSANVIESDVILSKSLKATPNYFSRKAKVESNLHCVYARAVQEDGNTNEVTVFLDDF